MLAWNVVVPAILGATPIIVLILAYPPPYTPWWEHSEGLLLLFLPPVLGWAAGFLALRDGTRFLLVAGSFWAAQSVAISLGASPDLLTGGRTTLYFSAALDLVLGVLPLALTFGLIRLAQRSSRRSSGAPVTWPGLESAHCSGCGQPLDPTWQGRCGRCGASYADDPAEGWPRPPTATP
jgi:hypothetical protein